MNLCAIELLLCWLQSDRLEQFYGAGLFGIGSGYDLEARCVVAAAAGPTRVTYDGGKFSQQGGEAVRRRPIVECVAGYLGQRGFGALGWCNRVAGGLGLHVGI